jgi:hypothetical protein
VSAGHQTPKKKLKKIKNSTSRHKRKLKNREQGLLDEVIQVVEGLEAVYGWGIRVWGLGFGD